MLHNPSNLYSEGNVVFDSTPYLKIALQEKAKRQARDAAVDKYYENLPNTINDKGVRDQEIPIIHDAVNKIQQYWGANKEAIKKGNTPEAYNYGKMFRDARGVSQMSSNEVAKTNKLYSMRTDPKKDYIFRDKNIIETIHRSQLPVNDPNFQSLDLDKITLPPAPFDQPKYFGGFKDIKYDEKTTTSTNPADKYTQIETKTPIMSEDAKNTVAQRAADQLIDNPSFENHIKSQMEKDPTLLPQLQKVFKDNFGRDINPMLADHDIAVAYTLSGIGNKGIKERIIPNKEAAIKRSEDFRTLMQQRGFDHDKAMVGFRRWDKEKSEEEKIKDVDGYIDDRIASAIKKPSGEGMGVFNISASPDELAAFGQKDEGTGKLYTPTAILYDKVNDNFILEKAGKNGGNIVINRPEVRASLVNHLFNTPVKLNQIHTTKTVDAGNKKTSSSSGFSLNASERRKQ